MDIFRFYEKFIQKIKKNVIKTIDNYKKFQEVVNDVYVNNVISNDEKKYIDNVISLNCISVKDIITPRSNMECININDNKAEILNKLKKGYTRYPVYFKDKDDIIGFIHVKDILLEVLNNDEIHINKILREVLYVPITMNIYDLFNLLKKDKSNLAIVVNEYGCIIGLLTITDILEELVGDIKDDFNESNITYNNGKHIVLSVTPIKEINKFFNINIVSDEIDTIGGYFYSKFGLNEELNTTMNLEIEDYLFQINEVKNRKIINISIIKK